MWVFVILVLVDDVNVVGLLSKLLNACEDSGDELSQAPSSMMDSGPGEHSDVNRMDGTMDDSALVVFPRSILSTFLEIRCCSSIMFCKYLP